MSISVRAPIAHPAQIAIGSMFGSPWAGWVLARRTAITLERHPRSASPAALIAVLWTAAHVCTSALALATEETGQVTPLLGGLAVISTVATYVWANRWCGDAARRRPPLDWVSVIGVAWPWALAVLAATVVLVILVHGGR